MFGSGNMTWIICNEEMHDIMEIIKSLEESALLIKDVNKKKISKAKEQKGWFLSVLLGLLGAVLLGNLLIGNGTVWTSESTVRAGQYF